MFKNKTLLITGGTGTFGTATIDRFLNTDIKEIRVFSRDEKKQDDLRHSYNNSKLKFYIGDVRSYKSIYDACYGVDYIFHAAALKQVPSCEFFPMEAVETNIIGANNVMSAAIERGVKKVIVLSTDKAVYPINAMGMSKALMEKTMISKSRDCNTILCGTRYGNVMASRGSVIPLFIDQIKSGKTITITNPDMTRFMMSISNAIDLVMFAFEHGSSGDIFVQKAPAATIGMLVDVIKDLCKAKNDVSVIGTRHGEKLFESLITSEEMSKAQDLGTYFRIPSDNRDLNYNTSIGSNSSYVEGYTSSNTHILTYDELKILIQSLGLI